jgi:hypothetical protein
MDKGYISIAYYVSVVPIYVSYIFRFMNVSISHAIVAFVHLFTESNNAIETSSSSNSIPKASFKKNYSFKVSCKENPLRRKCLITAKPNHENQDFPTNDIFDLYKCCSLSKEETNDNEDDDDEGRKECSMGDNQYQHCHRHARIGALLDLV